MQYCPGACRENERDEIFGFSEKRKRGAFRCKRLGPVGEFEHLSDVRCGTQISNFLILLFLPITNPTV